MTISLASGPASQVRHVAIPRPEAHPMWLMKHRALCSKKTTFGSSGFDRAADLELPLCVHCASAAEMLDQIRRGNVTWRYDQRERRSYQLWTSEHDYTLVTYRLGRLANAGLAQCMRGAAWNRGEVTLTEDGAAALQCVKAAEAATV